MKRVYCVQNEGDCGSCALSSYGRDCQNNVFESGVRVDVGRIEVLLERAIESQNGLMARLGQGSDAWFVCDGRIAALESVLRALRGDEVVLRVFGGE